MNTERNTPNAMAFYVLMFNRCRPAEAIERYAGVEHWDVLQVVPAQAANPNTMF